MPFEVIWLDNAQIEVNDLWEDDSLRGQLSQAVRTIDKWLSEKPLDVGQSREDAQRVWFFRPFVVIYDVDETASLVRVASIWVIR